MNVGGALITRSGAVARCAKAITSKSTSATYAENTSKEGEAMTDQINKGVCFANVDGLCSVLQSKGGTIKAGRENCGRCKFFKTRAQYAKDRLRSIDDEADFLGLSDFQKNKLRKKLYRDVIANEEEK